MSEKTEKKNIQSSSQILYKVHKYRGVKPAFRDEFKEPFNFPKIPIWAVAILLILFVIFGVWIAYESGVLDQYFPNGVV